MIFLKQITEDIEELKCQEIIKIPGVLKVLGVVFGLFFLPVMGVVAPTDLSKERELLLWSIRAFCCIETFNPASMHLSGEQVCIR